MQVQSYNTPHPICHLLSFSIAKKRAKIHAYQIDIQTVRSAKKFQNSPATAHAGLHLTSTDARRVRPHQTAYSIGKRVNEGRTRRASVPAKWNAIRKIKPLIKPTESAVLKCNVGSAPKVAPPLSSQQFQYKVNLCGGKVNKICLKSTFVGKATTILVEKVNLSSTDKKSQIQVK